jgi:hypothetical protein
MLYRIHDNLGTSRTTWTLRGAMAWLPYLGPVAVIANRVTRRMVVARTQYRPGHSK